MAAENIWKKGCCDDSWCLSDNRDTFLKGDNAVDEELIAPEIKSDQLLVKQIVKGLPLWAAYG